MQLRIVALTITLITIFSHATSPAAVYLVPNRPLGEVGLAWDPSPDPEVKGYWIYYGTNGPRVSQQVSFYTDRHQVAGGSVTNTSLTNLVRGATYYITATAYITGGTAGATSIFESDFCNEVIYAVPPRLAPPGQLKTNMASVRVSLQKAPSMKGPWEEFTDLWASTEVPGFYRAHVYINPPAPIVLPRKREFPPIPGR